MKTPNICTALLLSLVITSLISGCNNSNKGAQNNKTSNQGAMAHNHAMHQHGNIEVSSLDANAAIPSAALTVTADAISGWNVQLSTKHFRFAPEKVNQDAAANEGHAHLYIDGYKWARMYGPWLHVKKLTAGKHVFEVKLNANDHSGLMHEGVVIGNSTEIIQQP